MQVRADIQADAELSQLDIDDVVQLPNRSATVTHDYLERLATAVDIRSRRHRDRTCGRWGAAPDVVTQRLVDNRSGITRRDRR